MVYGGGVSQRRREEKNPFLLIEKRGVPLLRSGKKGRTRLARAFLGSPFVRPSDIPGSFSLEEKEKRNTFISVPAWEDRRGACAYERKGKRGRAHFSV